MNKRLILPIPPSVNHSHRNIRRGDRLMRIRSDATREFHTESGWLARKWMRESGWKIPEPTQKIVLRYWCFWANSRKRDTGNVEKVTTDALKGIVFVDDQYILPRAMDFSVDREHPRIEIELELVT